MKSRFVSMEDVESDFFENHMKDIAKAKKLAANSQGKEELANHLWRELQACKINADFIRIFDLLKKKSYRNAWVNLEQCEIACASLIRNSTPEFQKEKRILYIQDKIESIQSLFPYVLFFSPGFTTGYYTCSICGTKVVPRNRCGHRKGIIYNGELCHHIGHEPDFKELSIVTNPVQKYSVAHDDKTLDFSVLNFLISNLEHAFERWSCIETRKSYPRKMFSEVSLQSKCPCKSGEIFSNCCNQKSEISIPHIDFLFEDKEDFEPKINFPY